jgi:hypothetical protein
MAKLWPAFLKGHIFALRNDPARAGQAFQYVIDHRSQSPDSMLYPMALLGRARAAASAGDPETAKRYYAMLLDLWKAADPDVQPLIEARREVARLR